MNEQFYDEMEPYHDKMGLYHSVKVGPGHGPSTGNGLLTTSIYALLQGEQHEAAIDQCEIEPGLYRRHPLQDDQEAHDDYIGISTVNSARANRILDYGKKHFFYYNNVRPGTLHDRDGSYNLSAFLGRHIDFIAHLYLAAGRKPNLVLRLGWAISLALTARSKIKNEDGRILEWIKIQAYKESGHKSLICDLAIKYFWTKMDENKLTMAKLWLNYTQDPGHPFCKYWEDRR